MGSVGDGYDNSMMEAFWSRMQVELLDETEGTADPPVNSGRFSCLGTHTMRSSGMQDHAGCWAEVDG
jgi:hypothetical protein